ncbi:MAG: hypothetical protein ACEY3J_02805 [Arsenophonus sp.]
MKFNFTVLYADRDQLSLRDQFLLKMLKLDKKIKNLANPLLN